MQLVPLYPGDFVISMSKTRTSRRSRSFQGLMQNDYYACSPYKCKNSAPLLNADNVVLNIKNGSLTTDIVRKCHKRSIYKGRLCLV